MVRQSGTRVGIGRAVLEAMYRAGRRAVLEGFLSRPAIYRAPAIRAELELRARANLSRRIHELSNGIVVG